MKIRNQTDIAVLKICLYKEDDPFHAVPVGAGVLVVPKDRMREWDPVPGEELPRYFLKAFIPASMDVGLTGAKINVTDDVSINRWPNGDYHVVIN